MNRAELDNMTEQAQLDLIAKIGFNLATNETPAEGLEQYAHECGTWEHEHMIIIWTDTQWDSRADYLADLADDFGLDIYTVESLADLLGDIELFDGLLVALEDAI